LTAGYGLRENSAVDENGRVIYVVFVAEFRGKSICDRVISRRLSLVIIQWKQ